VTNALKHGKASVIRLQVAFQDEALMLEVADDGAGFDIATIAGPGQGHYGMQGMRERAKRLGAELEIESQPGRGSSIRVRMRKDVMLRSVASVEPFDEPKLG
jgi:signal transduction histidine kinase